MTRVAPAGSWRTKKSKPLSLVAGCVVSATASDHWEYSHTSPNEAAVVVQTSSDLTRSPTLGHSNWLHRRPPNITHRSVASRVVAEGSRAESRQEYQRELKKPLLKALRRRLDWDVLSGLEAYLRQHIGVTVRVKDADGEFSGPTTADAQAGLRERGTRPREVLIHAGDVFRFWAHLSVGTTLRSKFVYKPATYFYIKGDNRARVFGEAAALESALTR